MLLAQKEYSPMGLFKTATSATGTITYPTGILAGDLIVLIDRPSSGASAFPTEVIPAGYTKLSADQNSENGGAGRQILIISYMIAPTALSGTVIGANGSAANGKVMYVFRKQNGSPVNSATPTLFPSDITGSGPINCSLTIPANSFPIGSLFFTTASGRNGGTINSFNMPAVTSSSLSPEPHLRARYVNFTTSSNPALVITAASGPLLPLTLAAFAITVD